MDNIFERASREKLTFTTPKGLLRVDDLWDLPLTSNTGKANIDDLWKSLRAQLKTDETSLIQPKESTNEIVQLQYDIVTHVGTVRMAENKAKLEVSARKERDQKIMAIIADKEMEGLKGKSIEDLKALLSQS